MFDFAFDDASPTSPTESAGLPQPHPIDPVSLNHRSAPVWKIKGVELVQLLIENYHLVLWELKGDVVARLGLFLLLLSYSVVVR